MYHLSLPTALLVVLAVTSQPRLNSKVDGFSTPSGVPCFGTSVQPMKYLSVGDTNTKRTRTIVFGILDDIMEEQDAAVDDQIEEDDNNKDVDDERLVELYHSLIFSSDLQSEISRRLDDCTDTLFLEYLNASSESSQDEEERQGLAELIDQIEQVKTETAIHAAAEKEKAAIAAKEEEEKEAAAVAAAAAATAATTKKSKALSNADVLKKANEIDAAIALSDEEKPSDFISDCREVVNLSRGFNDSGQMRVGGR